MARVLLVDDDAEGLTLRKLILELHGHQVTTAEDPAEARLRASEGQLDCIISDLRLPDVSDGLLLIRDFRQQLPHIRLVILSGAVDTLSQAESAMVDEILEKPARLEQLLQAVTGSSGPRAVHNG